MECLDDATVAVQLEPALIKAIKKGGFSARRHQNVFRDFGEKEPLGFRRVMHLRYSSYLVCQCLLCG